MIFDIEFSPSFYEDLLGIKNYIALDSLEKANIFVLKLISEAESIAAFPYAQKDLQEFLKENCLKNIGI